MYAYVYIQYIYVYIYIYMFYRPSLCFDHGRLCFACGDFPRPPGGSTKKQFLHLASCRSLCFDHGRLCFAYGGFPLPPGGGGVINKGRFNKRKSGLIKIRCESGLRPGDPIQRSSACNIVCWPLGSSVTHGDLLSAGFDRHLKLVRSMWP